MAIITRTFHLRVNPIACDAFGYCAELAPELVALDEWGFPVIADRPIPPQLFDVVQRAVRECPRQALFFQEHRRRG